jgi:hypothetical protein
LDQAFFEVPSKGEINKFNLIKSFFKPVSHPTLKRLPFGATTVTMHPIRAG